MLICGKIAWSAKENTNFVTRELTECLAPEFEDLKKDRHIFSFNNGIYITKVKNPKADDEDNDEQIWIDQWIPFDGPGSKKIGASVVSSKYFDLEFEDCSKNKEGYEDWFEIIKKKCPHFKKCNGLSTMARRNTKMVMYIDGKNVMRSRRIR